MLAELLVGIVEYVPAGHIEHDDDEACDEDSPELTEPLGQAVHTELLEPAEYVFVGQGTQSPPEEKVPGPQARQDEVLLCSPGSFPGFVP